jgi:hypothetical protein
MILEDLQKATIENYLLSTERKNNIYGREQRSHVK